jgi:hypothetical protein
MQDRRRIGEVEGLRSHHEGFDGLEGRQAAVHPSALEQADVTRADETRRPQASWRHPNRLSASIVTASSSGCVEHSFTYD